MHAIPPLSALRLNHRLRGSYECLFLLHNLRALNSRVTLSQIAGASNAIAHVDLKDKTQKEVSDMLGLHEYSAAGTTAA
jgi:hypothetical protein